MFSHSEEETKKIAAEFAAQLSGGEIIFLEGDLGSGKTTFVRGVAEALGFDRPVRSPTFTLMNKYPLKQKHVREIVHIDLYRIKDTRELETLALNEELGRSETISFVEWPNEALVGKGISPTKRIQFSTLGTEHRIDIE